MSKKNRNKNYISKNIREMTKKQFNRASHILVTLIVIIFIFLPLEVNYIVLWMSLTFILGIMLAYTVFRGKLPIRRSLVYQLIAFLTIVISISYAVFASSLNISVGV